MIKTHPHKDKRAHITHYHLVSVVESVVTTGVLVVYPVTHVTMLAQVAWYVEIIIELTHPTSSSRHTVRMKILRMWLTSPSEIWEKHMNFLWHYGLCFKNSGCFFFSVEKFLVSWVELNVPWPHMTWQSWKQLKHKKLIKKFVRVIMLLVARLLCQGTIVRAAHEVCKVVLSFCHVIIWLQSTDNNIDVLLDINLRHYKVKIKHETIDWQSKMFVNGNLYVLYVFAIYFIDFTFSRREILWCRRQE